jgi:hypothetical protein
MFARKRFPGAPSSQGELATPRTPALAPDGYLPREGEKAGWILAVAEDILRASYDGTGKQLVESLLKSNCHVLVGQQALASRYREARTELEKTVRPYLEGLKGKHPEKLIVAEILPGIEGDESPWLRDTLGFFVEGVTSGSRYVRTAGQSGFVCGRGPMQRRVSNQTLEKVQDLTLWDAGGYFYPLGTNCLAVSEAYLERNRDIFGDTSLEGCAREFARFGRPRIVLLKGLEQGHGHVDFCVAQVGDTVFVPELRSIPDSSVVNKQALVTMREILDHNRRQLAAEGFEVCGLPMPIPLDQRGPAMLSPLNMAQSLNSEGERCCIVPWLPPSNIEVSLQGRPGLQRLDRWPDQYCHSEYQEEIVAKLKAAGAQHISFVPTAPARGGSAHCMTKEFPLELAKALAR